MKIKNICEKILVTGCALVLPGETVDVYLDEKSAAYGVEEGMIEIVELDKPALSIAEIKAMKKDQLVSACNDFGLDCNGMKVADLRNLLVEAICNDGQ